MLTPWGFKWDIVQKEAPQRQIFRKAVLLDLVSLRLTCYYYVIILCSSPGEGLNCF